MVVCGVVRFISSNFTTQVFDSLKINLVGMLKATEAHYIRLVQYLGQGDDYEECCFMHDDPVVPGLWTAIQGPLLMFAQMVRDKAPRPERVRADSTIQLIPERLPTEQDDEGENFGISDDEGSLPPALVPAGAALQSGFQPDSQPDSQSCSQFSGFLPGDQVQDFSPADLTQTPSSSPADLPQTPSSLPADLPQTPNSPPADFSQTQYLLLSGTASPPGHHPHKKRKETCEMDKKATQTLSSFLELGNSERDGPDGLCDIAIVGKANIKKAYWNSVSNSPFESKRCKDHVYSVGGLLSMDKIIRNGPDKCSISVDVIACKVIKGTEQLVKAPANDSPGRKGLLTLVVTTVPEFYNCGEIQEEELRRQISVEDVLNPAKQQDVLKLSLWGSYAEEFIKKFHEKNDSHVTAYEQQMRGLQGHGGSTGAPAVMPFMKPFQPVIGVWNAKIKLYKKSLEVCSCDGENPLGENVFSKTKFTWYN